MELEIYIFIPIIYINYDRFWNTKGKIDVLGYDKFNNVKNKREA
jgi:hypothetical protein